MRRFNLLVIFLACPMMMFGQLKIQSDGVFKMNNTLAGSIGKSEKTNVSFGYGTLSSTLLTGNWITANGFEALCANTSGNFNTANGYRALYTNTTGSYNTANGFGALYKNLTGNFNTANGYSAL